MENNRRIELVLWGLFLVLLFSFVLIFTNLDSDKRVNTVSTKNVINSYNTNNYYYYSYDYSYSNSDSEGETVYLEKDNYAGLINYKGRDCQDTAPRFNEMRDYYYNYNSGSGDISYPSHYSKPVASPFCPECLEVPIPHYSNPDAYSSVGNYKKESLFGSYADVFRVIITNKGQSDYFRVEYDFYSCSGKQTEQEADYYISNGQEKELYVRDISHDSDAYCSWDYKVTRLKE